MRFVLLAFVALAQGPLAAEAWVGLAVPEGREAATSRLAEAGVPWIGLSNAVVELSAFGPVEETSVAGLPARLTEPDPRWDPWLRAASAMFRDGDRSVVWVPSGRQDDATRLLAGSGTEEPLLAPRRVAGWTLAALAVLWGVLLVCTGRRAPRRGALALVPAVALGLWMAAPASGTDVRVVAPTAELATFEQHLWYQWAYPYGALWQDYAPGKAVTLATATRDGGRLRSAPVVVFQPDAAWLQARLDALAPTNLARLVASGLP